MPVASFLKARSSSAAQLSARVFSCRTPAVGELLLFGLDAPKRPGLASKPRDPVDPANPANPALAVAANASGSERDLCRQPDAASDSKGEHGLRTAEVSGRLVACPCRLNPFMKRDFLLAAVATSAGCCGDPCL